MRSLAIALPLLFAASLALPALAGGRFDPRRGSSHGVIERVTGRPTPSDSLRAQAERQRRFTEQRRAEAGVRLLEQRRAAEHRRAAAELRRSGTPEQVRSYRRRVELTERSDDLRIRRRIDQMDPEWWSGLGPHTRRVFEDSDVFVRRAQRQRELRRELDDLERAVEENEPAPPFSESGTTETR